MTKLTKSQEELLRAMQGGVTLNYHPWCFACNAYFSRSDTHKQCTRTATALEQKGLIENVRQTVRRTREYQLTEAGRMWPDVREEKTP